ncbi:methyltransferase domain-containing protein [Lactobacillus sp. ESL0236]|uniref:Eco57I restriction-modification methylase domain-containing protein n=1 Tax=unclassified Lactobacillus TaxID=2620435 RepID=UPI000EFBC94F|nr:MULTISPECIES: N-6 DNA methylase [unclassified Lactobacillus]RMC38536.1 methyltransferase domain-containing protein [Lactobacillus sp. ESL0237]RMC42881.1 methyltransferase domain-containing protein [Lactobacillus sp. ESL0234]RMC43735.1 methyltransferase domain-containing protein [Lactobacillus sp. ESL0236]
MLLKENNPENKLRGIYYTPRILANAIVDKINLANIKSILEPSCGEGVFINALENECSNAHITAIDNDKDAIKAAKRKFSENHKLNISCEDFFDFYNSERKYDLIIGNPPYIRYQYLTDNQRNLQAKILTTNGMKSNKLINAWVAFLVACVRMLSNDGIIAFVIPAELLQVAYAEDLRTFLMSKLDFITVITFKELIFSDVQQETIVLYGKKGVGNGKIRIVDAADANDFRKMDLSKITYQNVADKHDKWTKYFTSDKETGLLDKIRADSRFKNLSDYGIINVGITTGNNKYFSITEETEKNYGLGSTTLPLIGRSSHVHGIYFTKEDWTQNRKAGKRAMLLSFPDEPYDEYPYGYKQYIAYGEEHEENRGYKCQIRNRWYIVPSVWVPDAFLLRRNYLYPKFVLNKCRAVSTDTMHRMKFHEGVSGEDVLLSYYNSISFAFTEICGRSYGGGVLEILPREMGKIRVPDISNVDKVLKVKLLQYIDQIVRQDDDIAKALEKVDNELLVECLGIPKSWCEEARNIWKTLQQRRLNRGEKL